jgi:hypothetical protein
MDYNRIAQTINTGRCRRHLLHPRLIPHSDKLELICCCDYFKEKLLKQIEKEKKKQNLENINVFLRGNK